MDAHWFGILAERFKVHADAGENTARGLCQAMVQDTIVNAKEANFAFKEDEATGRDVPAWDDLSATLIVIPAVFQPAPPSPPSPPSPPAPPSPPSGGGKGLATVLSTTTPQGQAE